jgi:hypothetical protein
MTHIFWSQLLIEPSLQLSFIKFLQSFPNTNENNIAVYKVNSSEYFNPCFLDRYHACPAFFPGSLFDACEAAFNAPDVAQVCLNPF